MGKRFLLLFLMIFSLSFVSANYDYAPKTKNTHSFNNPTYHENENRFQTYDYRHGYTYRSTDEFRRTHNSIYLTSYQRRNSNEQRAPYYSHNHEMNFYYNNNYGRYWDHHRYKGHNNRHINPYQETKNYYHLYNPYRNSYTLVECYTSPPAGLLFYRRCP
jgi:hypothetical protein